MTQIKVPRAVILAATLAALSAACRPRPALRGPIPAGGFMPLEEPGRLWTIRDAFATLRFQNPVFALMPPRDGSVWFVGEREGRLLAVPHQEGAGEKTTVLDLRSHTLGWQDTGLLAMAFHPQYGQPGSPNRGYIYLWYNHTNRPFSGPGHPPQAARSANRLSRFTISDGARVADPASELVLIEQERTNTDHQGGGMFFHPDDGFLYLGVGDGGHEVVESRGHSLIVGADEAQRIDRDLLSGILRIDVDRRGGKLSHPIRRQPQHGRTQGYFVPDSNPWLDPGGGLLEEFFAIGLRNPHRMTYDPPSKRAFIGDVGEGRWEEIDVLERAANYQWSFREADEPFGPRPQRLRGSERPPLHGYPHRGFNSVIGGFVYRGRAYPELRGRYLFGDTGTGEIWTLDAQARAPAAVTPLLRLPQEMTTYGGLASFAVDAEGEIYLCILGNNEAATGTLQRLVRLAPTTRAAAARLSQTGLFQDTARLVPTAALFPYELNVPFWSDHATKQRWLHVPEGARIGFRPEGEWQFPAGTIAVKHFDLAVDERDPARRRRLETRVLVLDAHGGAYGRTYKWRSDGSDADLVTAPITERLTATSKIPFGPLGGLSLGGRGDGRVGQNPQGVVLASPAAGTLFAHVAEMADFDVAAGWRSVSGGRAGLMVRTGAAAGDAVIAATWEAVGQRFSVERRQGGGASRLGTFDAAGGWMRLKRQGGDLVLFTGPDGHLWREATRVAWEPGRTLVGLAVTAPRGVARAELSSVVRVTVRDHYYPSNEECMACHTQSAHFVLGATTRQWNREVAGKNQLVLAAERRLFDTEIQPEDPAQWKRLRALDDTSAPLVERVRSYLDANCAQCHRPGGVVQVGIDARYDTPLAAQGLIKGRIRWPNVRSPEELIVTPRDLDRSRIFDRVSHARMPPLGGLLVNEPAVELLRNWIMSLEGPAAMTAVDIAPGRPDGAGRFRVELRHADAAARIHFTLDGTAPSPETPRYTQPFELARPTLVRAAAFRDGYVPSRVSSAMVGPRR
jgi:glucose/arabinose dehydrogenase/mono/diheme cytochrome c family protein